MHVDVMTGPGSWANVQRLARDLDGAGLSGIVFTEGAYTPWLSVAAAHHAAPRLHLATGVAVAFPRSPMVAAQTAWELAELTGGQFRLGLGSQVKAHVERRYGSEFSPPVARMRDYVLAVKDSLAAFRGEAPLAHDGPYYALSLMSAMSRPRRHAHEDVKVDMAAVGDAMVTAAGEVADGIHVHPFHSMHYVREQLVPTLVAATERAGRGLSDVDLIVPVLVAPGDAPEDRAPFVERCRAQVAFYGSTKNYAFQFDDLGFDGLSARLNERLKAGDPPGMAALVTDEVLSHFAVVGAWADVADELVDRYGDLAHRLVMYTAVDGIKNDPPSVGRWGELARAISSR